MKLTLESTGTILELLIDGARVPARLWQGETESGVPVHAYITRVAVPLGRPPADYAAFEAELLKCAQPRPDLRAIPLRLIL